MYADKEQDISYPGVRVAVVLVKKGENENQAWRRHLMDNPEDSQAEVKIFHFA